MDQHGSQLRVLINRHPEPCVSGGLILSGNGWREVLRSGANEAPHLIELQAVAVPVAKCGVPVLKAERVNFTGYPHDCLLRDAPHANRRAN